MFIALLFKSYSTMEKTLHLVSFGFRSKNPEPGDLTFDVRKGVFNPFHVAGDKTGLDNEISQMVLEKGGRAKVDEIVQQIELLMVTSRHVKVSIGCVGGRHRSVAVVEEVARILKERESNMDIHIQHRDINT
jgi:UPF0042 nucleotide-binding protein